MAPSVFSLLLRHFSHHHYLRHNRRLFLSPPLLNHFSTSSSLHPDRHSSEPSKPSSLSARLSFVFDKIDEIENERSEKDQALQRIRAWRDSKKKTEESENSGCNDKSDKLGLGLGVKEAGGDSEFDSELKNNDGNAVEGEKEKKNVGLIKREVELAHPWPEWIELMERLVQQNYFDHRRKDEDSMIEGLGSVDEVSEVADDLGFDFTRDWDTVQTAVLNFARDRFDILRSLSRQDIQLLVGYGCPISDKKVTFSAKLLRKYAHLDEGDVCSACNLRTTCQKAYLVTNKEDEARMTDVMRILLVYGFDPISGTVENKSLLKKKSVKTVVRKLLHQVVRLSAVPIDPHLPPPVIKKPPPKVKQPPPPPKKRVGRDDIEMKKGDWLCTKCNFMNFAKNHVCLQCDAKRPKRQLLPGEWECPQCNFLNYRRNMACFNCEHKRPPDEYMENQTQGRQHRPVTRMERVVNRAELPNAWNFDFDDDESDGADVAAFEYADARAMNEDRLLNSQTENVNFSRGRDENLYREGRTSRSQENEHSRPAQAERGVGFDDFDDEDDDIDSYEVDNQNRSQLQEASSVRFSDVEGYSESEGDDNLRGNSTSSSSYAKSSRPLQHRGGSSDSVDNDVDFDSDDDLPIHPKWKSSHVADAGRRDRGSRGTFGSDEDDRLAFGSDDDLEEDFTTKRARGDHRNSERRGFRGGDSGNLNRRQSGFGGRQDVNFVERSDSDDEFGGKSSQGRRGSFDHERGNRRASFDNDHGNRRGSFNDKRGNRRGSFDNERGNRRGSFENGRGNRRGSFQDDRGNLRGSFDDVRGNQRRSFDNDRGNLRESFDDERGNWRGSFDNEGGNRRGSFDSKRGSRKMDRRGRGGMQDFNGSRGRGSGNWSDVDNDIPNKGRINVR